MRIFDTYSGCGDSGGGGLQTDGSGFHRGQGAKAELVWAAGSLPRADLGPKGVIFFSDIGMRTMRFDPASGKTTVFREPSGKANGLMMDRKGNLIACEGAHAASACESHHAEGQDADDC